MAIHNPSSFLFPKSQLLKEYDYCLSAKNICNASMRQKNHFGWLSEEWELDNYILFFQAWMSICVIVVQYCVPCAMVTFYYISICRFLASRPILASDERQKQILAKRRKNNRMLITVTVAHFTSWLPLNVINIVLTMFDSDESPLFTNVEHLYIAYAMCHLASMTSAISNPVLYGFMNDNFRGEFDKIWQRFCKCKTVESNR